MPARLACEFLLVSDYLQSAASEVTFPFYLFYGLNDKICNVEGMLEWYDLTSSKDKQYASFPDRRHESLNEVCSSELTYNLMGII